MKLSKEWEIQGGKEKYNYEKVNYDLEIRRIVFNLTEKNLVSILEEMCSMREK